MKEGVAVVLAGGESRRMGTDKALLSHDGVSLLEFQILALESLFERLIVSVGHAGPSVALVQVLERLPPGVSSRVRVVADRRASQGPVEGVRCALNVLGAPRGFFIAVDVPVVHLPLVRWLCEEGAVPGRLGCVPVWSAGVEPACAVYHRDLLPYVDEYLEQGESRLGALAKLPGVVTLALEDDEVLARLFTAPPPPGEVVPRLRRILRNVNSPEDYRRWCKEAGGSHRGDLNPPAPA